MEVKFSASASSTLCSLSHVNEKDDFNLIFKLKTTFGNTYSVAKSWKIVLTPFV